MLARGEAPITQGFAESITESGMRALDLKMVEKQDANPIENEWETPAMMQQPKINETGFSVLHDPKGAVADLVFVHGLQGHPRTTWTSAIVSGKEPHVSGTAAAPPRRKFEHLVSRIRTERIKDIDTEAAKGRSIFWPLDLLPTDCADARILTWGYDSKISHFFHGPANQSNIAAHAKNLLQALRVRRFDCQDRSLIFVAHSLGGLIVKEVVRRAAEDRDPTLLSIYTATDGILFLGTPHWGGSKGRLGEAVRKIVSVSGFDTSDKNLRTLRIDNTELELFHELFMKVYERKDRNFKVFTFQEGKGLLGVRYLKLNERIVKPSSSSLTGAESTQIINANHTEMCRFSSADDEGYQQITGELKILLLGVRVKLEKVMREQNSASAQTKSGSLSPSTTFLGSYSLDDIERNCVALLTQDTTNAAEYMSSLPAHVDGTCQWILSDPRYREWNLQSETRLLWVTGYAGSGKTILSAYVSDHLASSLPSSSPRALCYFFCDEKIGTQRDGLSILRSLIYQLVNRRRSLIRFVKSAYNYSGPQFRQDFLQLWEVFLDIARQSGPTSVIIDAIDECEERTREKLLRKVADLTRMQSTGSQPLCIKFFITSRPSMGYQNFIDDLKIDLSQDHVELDLRLVIRTKVSGIVRRISCKPEIGIYLENTLYSKADGTFLWVTLVLNLLEKSISASQKDFKRIIDQLPKTLTATYERFLREIPLEAQSLATRLLNFLVGSSRPLNLEEVRMIIALQDHNSLAKVEEDMQPNVRKMIEEVLGPLVRVFEGRVYLVHQSLKEFLLHLATQTQEPLSEAYGIDPERANLLLAQACISYLLLDDFKDDLFSSDASSVDSFPPSPGTVSAEEESLGFEWGQINMEEDIIFKDSASLEAKACDFIIERYPLFDYASRYWAEHFLHASAVSSLELQESAISLLDCRTSSGLNFLRFYWSHAELDLECPRDFDPAVAACYFGLEICLISVLRKTSLTQSEGGPRSLYWASRMGHCKVVEILLKENVNPDVTFHGQTAFIAAVSVSRLDVVKVFLRDDGLIPERDEFRVNLATTGGRTPLSIAAGNGAVEIVEQLLQHSCITPDLPDFDHWTPLFWSISRKQLDVVKVLVTDGRLSLNHLDKSGRHALSWAASFGWLDTVQYLLSQKEIKANGSDRNGRTALSWAAGNGHLETTIFLRRSQRIDVSQRDNDGRNAISWACSGGHHKVVEYLLKYDPAGADRADIDNWTPLSWALFNQAPETVQVLLSSGLVDVNGKDGSGRSALSWAAGYGYLDVVKLLVNAKGIDIGSKDNDGRTPLWYANRHPDIVKVLQEA